MARKRRIIQTERPYHLVCRTNNRAFRFHHDIAMRLFTDVLKIVQERYGLRIHHFVLMSNHYHIIATATQQNIHRAMQYLNARIAERYNRAVGRTGHLWSGRYKSCILATDEHYRAAVRYIYRNPLRARTVKHLEDFGNSSFLFWAFGKKVGLSLDEDHLVKNLGGNRVRISRYFRNLVRDESAPFIQDADIKIALRGPFLGSPDFLKQMKDRYLCF